MNKCLCGPELVLYHRPWHQVLLVHQLFEVLNLQQLLCFQITISKQRKQTMYKSHIISTYIKLYTNLIESIKCTHTHTYCTKLLVEASFKLIAIHAKLSNPHVQVRLLALTKSFLFCVSPIFANGFLTYKQITYNNNIYTCICLHTYNKSNIMNVYDK